MFHFEILGSTFLSNYLSNFRYLVKMSSTVATIYIHRILLHERLKHSSVREKRHSFIRSTRAGQDGPIYDGAHVVCARNVGTIETILECFAF